MASQAASGIQQRKIREDFEFIKEIGEGSFSTVHLAKDKSTGNLFASIKF